MPDWMGRMGAADFFLSAQLLIGQHDHEDSEGRTANLGINARTAQIIPYMRG